MVAHYTIYGLTGLVLEVFWTSLGSLLLGNYALTGQTYFGCFLSTVWGCFLIWRINLFIMIYPYFFVLTKEINC